MTSWADWASALDLETPAYVYDLGELRRSHALLRRALPSGAQLFYSLKANAHPSIVRALSALGCWLEVSSPGELAVALSTGSSAGNVLSTGPGKRDGEIAAALSAGVRWLSVESPTGLDQADRVGAALGITARCLLRINDRGAATAKGLTMTGLPSQFGADADWIRSEPWRFASRQRAEVVGLHLYMGSNLDGLTALIAQFAASITTAREISDVLQLKPQVLDIGGGFAAPFARSGALESLDALRDTLAGLLDEAFPQWRTRRPLVAVESGRYLAATCGRILTRAEDVKRSHGKPVVILESGINHLGGMSGLRRLPPIVPEVQLPGDDSPRGRLRGAILAGPLCTPLDTWATATDLPALKIGDVICVPNVGAYGLRASLLGFLCHPAPREIVIDGGKTVEVSQLEIHRRQLGAEPSDKEE